MERVFGAKYFCGAENMSMDGSSHGGSVGGGGGARRRRYHPRVMKRSVISPHDPKYRIWQNFLLLLVVYTALVAPFQYGFLFKPVGGLEIADIVIDGVFLIDIYHLLCWLPYATSWLIFDVIAAIPFQLFAQQYALLSIVLRLWRLRRVCSMFAAMEKDIKSNYVWVRCFRLFCQTIFYEETLGVRYVTSIYWSVTTFTTVGYGDLHPVTTMDMLVSICYMLFNLGYQSYLIENTLVNLGMQFKLLPMLSNLCLKFRIDSEGLQQQETLEALPKAIHSSISHFRFDNLVDKVYLFQGVSKDFLFHLVSEMEHEFFPPKEDVILQNETPTDFYILVTGTVIGELRTGDIFGEIGVLCYKPQLFQVRTKNCANVRDGTIIMNNLLQHLKEMNGPVMQKVLMETENMLAHGKLDLPLSLCFAAHRGDDLLLHQLLKKGEDPNETDENGRTALHIAASSGSKNYVVPLLDCEADQNNRDPTGNAPPWEAIVGKLDSVVKVLIDNGWNLSSGDIGQFACTAVEQNSPDLLKEIVEYGGDVKVSKRDGTTALHVAVCEGNIDLVRFLLEQGCDIDKADGHGWTPRKLDDQQAHEEIKLLFQSKQEPKHQPAVSHKSEPTITHPVLNDPGMKVLWRSNRQLRRISHFHKSIFGMMSIAHAGDRSTNDDYSQKILECLLKSLAVLYPARVTISCQEVSQTRVKLVFLPNYLEELFGIGTTKFGFSASRF
ncbi:hypothetical protein MKX01_003426 [Papaver californicum]|nr:hypothetical protein MKX01_003426 [Papaver californicum]